MRLQKGGPTRTIVSVSHHATVRETCCEIRKERDNPLYLARFRNAITSASSSEPRQFLKVPSDMCHRSCCHNIIVVRMIHPSSGSTPDLRVQELGFSVPLG